MLGCLSDAAREVNHRANGSRAWLGSTGPRGRASREQQPSVARLYPAARTAAEHGSALPGRANGSRAWLSSTLPREWQPSVARLYRASRTAAERGLALPPHDRQHVVEQCRCSDRRTGARGLDQQRLGVVTIAVNRNALVGLRATGRALTPSALKATLGDYPALGKAAAAAIPGATLVTFDDLGHSPQVQDPKRFNAALLKALKENVGKHR